MQVRRAVAVDRRGVGRATTGATCGARRRRRLGKRQRRRRGQVLQVANVVQPTVHVGGRRRLLLLLLRLGHVMVVQHLLLPTVKAAGIDAGRRRLLLWLLLLLRSHADDGRRLGVARQRLVVLERSVPVMLELPARATEVSVSKKKTFRVRKK